MRLHMKMSAAKCRLFGFGLSAKVDMTRRRCKYHALCCCVLKMIVLYDKMWFVLYRHIAINPGARTGWLVDNRGRIVVQCIKQWRTAVPIRALSGTNHLNAAHLIDSHRLPLRHPVSARLRLRALWLVNCFGLVSSLKPHEEWCIFQHVFFSYYAYWHGIIVKITEMYWEAFVLLLCKVL